MVSFRWGLMIFGDMQYASAEFEDIISGKTKICNFIILSMFSKVQRTIKEEIQVFEEKPRIVKTQKTQNM